MFVCFAKLVKVEVSNVRYKDNAHLNVQDYVIDISMTWQDMTMRIYCKYSSINDEKCFLFAYFLNVLLRACFVTWNIQFVTKCLNKRLNVRIQSVRLFNHFTTTLRSFLWTRHNDITNLLLEFDDVIFSWSLSWNFKFLSFS